MSFGTRETKNILVSPTFNMQGCIHAYVSLPWPHILHFLPRHFLSMISFTVRLSKELFTDVYTHAPLPHLTFSQSPS